MVYHLFATLAVIATAQPTLEDFEAYCKKFSKEYTDPEEHAQRFELYKVARIRIDNHEDSKTWTVGLNHMSDWSSEEFSKLLGYKRVNLTAYGFKQPSTFEYDPSAGIPSAVDWRDAKVVTAVKNQGHCGSCWTFASAETLESHYAIATGELKVLSEQNILDCTPNPDQCGGTGGCMGGTAELAFAQLQVQGGILSEWTYPYQSYFGDAYKCRFDKIKSGNPVAATVTQYAKLQENSLSETLHAVAKKGPISVSVDASSWSSYTGGVFDGCNQTNPDINHAVQLVGYGTDPVAGDYWLVRNSWGTSWGENGYIRLKKNNAAATRCGTDTTPLDGTGCQGGPATQHVCGTCGILFDNVYPIVES